MIVEIELVVHAHKTSTLGKGDALGIFIHGTGERVASRGYVSGEEAAEVGEEVVGHLGAALQVYGSLVVVPNFVAYAPFVVVWVCHIKTVGNTLK
jgi:hypothetical protein